MRRMNLYSNKQKWKIALLILALLLVGASLFVSNNIVDKVGEREKERAKQWADAIQKKIELVKLTNNTFTKLRDNERQKMKLFADAQSSIISNSMSLSAPVDAMALKIVEGNNDIPVILVDNFNNCIVRNVDIDRSSFEKLYPDLSRSEWMAKYNDSLIRMAKSWAVNNEPIGPLKGFEEMEYTFYYNDTKAIQELENERDSLIASFNEDLIHNKALVPVLLVDSDNNKIIGTNIDTKKIDQSNLIENIEELKSQNDPITIDFQNGKKYILYFGASPELKQLQYFPYIQFLVFGLFIFIGYLIFSTFRKAEQNQVWAGMAKETAHQLGTPLSSLMAWVQILESQGVDASVTTEMQKDVDRLEKITDRFSKIGSGALLEEGNITSTVRTIVDYLRPRISDKVEVEFKSDGEFICNHNPSLMEWVVENISKNAVDAMEGVGTLTINIHADNNWIHVDITDTGKGIQSKQHKTIFEPGFSTKKRGWGLGLSLVKRIVNEYHKGKVFVLESQPTKGTTFRISLPATNS